MLTGRDLMLRIIENAFLRSAKHTIPVTMIDGIPLNATQYYRNERDEHIWLDLWIWINGQQSAPVFVAGGEN